MSRMFLALGLVGCAEGINQQLHVQTDDGVVLPVLVRGNLEASDTLVLYEAGGPYGGGVEERVVDYWQFSETLEPHVAIAYYDRRGYGNANGRYGPDDITLDHLMSDVDDLIAVLLDRYDPDQMVLMGHSFGGFATGQYLVTRPDAPVDAWVSVAGAVVTGGERNYVPYRLTFACRVARDQIAKGDDDALWAEIDTWCATDPEVDPEDWEHPGRIELSRFLDAIYERAGEPPIDAGKLVSALFGSSYNVTDLMLTSNELSGPLTDAREALDLMSDLDTVDVPTLFVNGEFDDIVPTEIAYDAAAQVPDSRVVEIEAMGHYPIWPDPEPFADAVLDFLR